MMNSRLTGLPKCWTEVSLLSLVSHKSGDSKIIKGKQSASPGLGLCQGYSASGPDVWVDKAQYNGPGIIVSAVGARCGKTFLAEGSWTAIANTHAIIPKAGIHPKFLWYVTNREDWWIKSGTAQPFVKVKDTLERPFPLPPLDEQEKIVEILEEQLSRLDAATAALEAVRTKADRFRLSMIESAIHGDMSEQFATAWDEMVLNDLVDAKSDIIDGPFGSNLKSEHYVASGARVIRLQNIGYGEFRDEAAFISFEHFERLKKHNVQTGDLLFASLGENLPRTCLVPDLGAPAIVKADCIRVRLSKNVNSRYVLMATQALIARTWAAEQLHGLGRPRLGLGNIRQFPVRLPPIEGQNRIVEFLDAQLETSGRIEERCSEYLNRIVGLRRSLLHAAFCGNLTKEWREAHNG
jgi:restriction endonuclease S subunit